MRVLHLPSAVGGNAWNLSQAERTLGITSHVLITDNSPFSFYSDLRLSNSGLWNSRFTLPIAAFHFYKTIMDQYDIFHFNFGSTLIGYQNKWLDMIDLPFLKRKGKAIAVTFQGTDARQASYCLNNFDHSFYHYYTREQIEEEFIYDRLKQRRIKKFDRYADLIYTINPDLKYVLPERTIFRPYTKLKLEDWQPSYRDYTKERLMAVHAPTNRGKKGTEFIVNTIKRLSYDGIKIDLNIIEGISNDKAKTLYRDADIVIDQLLIGWYGGLAVECMALGKPVIAYLRESDLRFLPKEMANDIPVISAKPDTLYEVIKSLYFDRSKLKDVCIKSRKYVEKWHNSITIASNVIKDYEQILNQKK